MLPAFIPCPAVFTRRLKWLSTALSIAAAAAFMYFIALPGGEKGLSPSRLAIDGALLLVELLLVAWVISLFCGAARLQLRLARLAGWLDRRRFEVLGITGFASLGGLYLSVHWIFLPPTYETGVTLPRLYPFLLLAVLFSAGGFILALPGRAAARSGGWMDRAAALMDPPYRLPRVLAWLAIFFAAACLACQVVRYAFPGLYRFVDFLVTEFCMDSEMNLPTFFSAALTILIALTLFFIAWATIRTGMPDRYYWVFLGLLFLFLPFDEVFSLHEMLTEPMQDRIYAVGVLYWPWFLPILPVLALLFFTYLRFLLRLSRRTFALIMLSAALFLGGAIALEALGAAFADEFGLANFPYMVISTIEETTELSGLVLFIFTLFEYYTGTFVHHHAGI